MSSAVPPYSAHAAAVLLRRRIEICVLMVAGVIPALLLVSGFPVVSVSDVLFDAFWLALPLCASVVLAAGSLTGTSAAVYFMTLYFPVQRPMVVGPVGWLRRIFSTKSLSLFIAQTALTLALIRVIYAEKHSVATSIIVSVSTDETSVYEPSAAAAFIHTHALVLATLFHFRYLVTNREHIRFPRVQLGKWRVWRHRLSTALITSLGYSIIWTLLIVAVYPIMATWSYETAAWFAFWLIEYAVYTPLFALTTISVPESWSPSLFHPWTDPALVLGASLAGAVALAVLELMHVSLEVFTTERITLGVLSRQFEYLVEGLNATEQPLVAMHALSELHNGVFAGPDGGMRFRRALFTDVTSHGGKDGRGRRAWIDVVVNLLVIIDTFKRGVDADFAKPVVAPAAVPVKKEPTIIAKSSHAIHPTKAVLREPDLGDAFGPSLLDHAAFSAKEMATRVTSRATTETRARLGQALMRTRTEAVTRSRSWWDCLATRWHILAVYRESVLRGRAAAVFADFQRVQLAAEILARLCASSIYEDPYGSVQKDLDRVLGALVGAVRSTEKRSKESPSLHGMRPIGIWQGQVTELQTLATIDTFERCVYEIIDAFHVHLHNADISAGVLNELKPFMEYRE